MTGTPATRPVIAVARAEQRPGEPDNSNEPGSRDGATKYCPTCKHYFPANQRFCGIDGVPLIDADPKRDDTRTCPRCKKSYDGGTRYCPIDGAPLSQPTAPAESNRTSRGDRDNAVGKANRVELKQPAAPSKPATPERNPAESKRAIPADRADDPARFAGTNYVNALRQTLSAPAESLAAREARLDKLAERSGKKRRTAIAIELRTDVDELRSALEPGEAEFARRLRFAGPRDLEPVPLSALQSSIGWCRIAIDISLARDQGDRQVSVTARLYNCPFAKEAEPTSEYSPENSEPADRGVIREPLGEAITKTGPLQATLDCVALELVRTLNDLVDARFDEAQKLAAQGKHDLAIEACVRYLCATPDFDSPQAELANQQIVAALRFSLLDWLWGEPEAAVVESGTVRRRLPIGFRAAPNEIWSDDLPRSIVCLRDGSEMVLVPGGTEPIGNDSGPPDERPAHAVTLRRFYIDKFETSIGQYERFLATGAQPVPNPTDGGGEKYWEGRAAKKNSHVLPVHFVSWHDARSFAQWAGKSLPTEAQWERAARGGFPADYPRSFDSGFTRHINAGGAGHIASVYGFSAALNPFGCQNMLGNVAEWCRDWYSADAYSRSPAEDPLGPDDGELRVLRGGSWQTPFEQLGASRRQGLPPTERSAMVGFRCVLNLPD